ncbi:hypothetical protein [Tepidibacter formicigenes]|jgi:hypothetical protein|uniref:Uncharacterized protein n=1 Tax=Tepidibacter formicigenes DSM 15518 TaxID=1123349 RepID=A0A1M6QZD9_9FIRM|nr:hypothetical protein [Tepidibacter formicigenes]SHK25592.1 hypothetical protein SAMN02744037_01989 [Tepidibacter formicigenes DSM 15518]
MKRILSLIVALVLLFSTFSYADKNSPYRDGYIEGYIKDRLDDVIQIEEYDGTLHTFTFTNDSIFIIDDRDAKLIDFKPGMEVYATLEGRKINYIESYSTQNPGYVKEGSIIRVGTVSKIDRNQISLKFATGDEETFFTSPATITIKDGQNVDLSTIYIGDRVKLYFDEINSSIVSKIYIQGDSILIKNLYKGKIGGSNNIEDTITLENVQHFKNGKWEKQKDIMTIPYNNEVPIYIGGAKVPYKNLKYYKGKTAYMVIKDFFGSDKIEKMVIKNQYEAVFSDKIEDINFYSESFELENKRNIGFNDGTIIIKSGRIVDKYSLNSESDAYVIADGRNGSLMADIIYVYNEDINNSNIGQSYIYSGKLDEIDEYSITLDDFYLLDKNEWESFDKKKDLYYDEDTYIYDLDNNKELTTEEFYTLDAEDENYYGYIYTDGDRISAIYVQEKMDSLLKQRTTNGVVETIYEDSKIGWTLKLQDAKDWSSRKEEWLPKNTSITVSIDKAVLIKNAKAITTEDIKAGDRLYIVRDDIYGKIIIVK